MTLLHKMVFVAAAATAFSSACAQNKSPGQKMAATVMRQWAPGSITANPTDGKWAYEEGVLLDGMAAEWHAMADGGSFRYMKASVDRYIGPDGTIRGYKADAHSLDDIEMGRATLLLYRVTQDARYAKAAHFLHDQLTQQPRTSGRRVLAQAGLSQPDVAGRRLHG